ncbi:competence protein CoiA [Solibacillus sp. FSL K6-4121]|uniref:competence protein CoiA n=1 Tax=Solibacillus sp. FSL K6-4121 TaxID=2921505 RepID=UPI0030F8C68C
MLVALTEKQQLFHLTSKLSEQELQQLKQQQQFYCPQCREELLLKAGQIKIPHFAHYKRSKCDSLFSERESTTHLLGKQQLFQHFTKLKLQPMLEPYLPHLRQRPDIFISKMDRQYAIEFQCSPISQDLFLQRTRGYLKANITPIWLLHTPEKFQASGMLKISINHFNAQFIQQYNNQYFLLTFDVKSKKFYYLSNLIHINKMQYFAFVKILPLHQQQFPFLIPDKIPKEIFRQFLISFRKYRDQYLRPRILLSKKGVNDRFLRALYELQLTTTNLPLYLGIPVKNTNAFDSFCLEWQVQLFYFMKCHSLIPKTMNQKAIPYFFEWSGMEQTSERKVAVVQYLKILKELNIGQVHESMSLNKLFEALYDECVAIGK